MAKQTKPGLSEKARKMLNAHDSEVRYHRVLQTKTHWSKSATA